MVEISRNPHKIISVAALETILETSTKQNYVSFVDSQGYINVLKYESKDRLFSFTPIASGGKATPIFWGPTSVEVVDMALRSGYRLLMFSSIEEMVRHYVNNEEV